MGGGGNRHPFVHLASLLVTQLSVTCPFVHLSRAYWEPRSEAVRQVRVYVCVCMQQQQTQRV